MFFKIDSRIFQQHPDCIIGVVVAHDIGNSASPATVIGLLKKQEDEIRQTVTLEKIVEYPQISSWHEAYKQFGANPKKHLSSIENLLRRIVQGRSVAGINTLVDLYNLVSLRYLLPAGGEDLDTIKGDIQLTIASDHEKPVFLLGDKEEHPPRQGEVFYKDDNGAICRRWNWKEADRTKLTNDTRNAVLVLEGLAAISVDVIKAALNELAMYIKEYCGGDISYALVTKTNPEIEIIHNGMYVEHNRPSLKSVVYHDPFAITAPSVQTAVPAVMTISDESAIRRAKMEAMRAQGIEPWPLAKPVSISCADIIATFNERATQTEQTIAGRVMSMRGHGKAVFVHIQDGSGKLQLYIKQDSVGDAQFKQWQQFVDIGDIIWCKGKPFKTKTGEITLHVDQFTMLSKCLHPLPDKFHGIADIELKYRQRYLDLISDPIDRKRFYDRSAIIRTLRTTFDAYGFMEVETPMLHPIPGGAVARPFITHHNALDIDLYLRIAPELYLKRLVVGGFERVYEINRNFRNEGISTRHNPEFTMVECYVTHKDYVWMMDFIEHLLRTVALTVHGATQVQFKERLIDFEAPFARMTMQEAVAHAAGCTISDLSDERIDAIAQKHGIMRSPTVPTGGHILYALFEKLVESQLWNPTFITDFPSVISPLAKRKPDNPELTDRFELFIAGMEIANGFNELNDPIDQAARFSEQVVARAFGDAEAHHFDADYIRALEYALPPTVGAGIGIDRLTMLMTDAHSIKDVILFPTLKPEK